MSSATEAISSTNRGGRNLAGDKGPGAVRLRLRTIPRQLVRPAVSLAGEAAIAQLGFDTGHPVNVGSDNGVCFDESSSSRRFFLWLAAGAAK